VSEPAVSVVIPSYNRAAVLGRAINSVIAQTFDDWEIVLVDDGSTDDTDALLARYADRLGPKLRVIRQENAGAAAARNRGIDAARGVFVAFLDSDDEFLPDKLQRQIELFRIRPELGLVYSDYSFVDLKGVGHQSVLDEFCPRARTVSMKQIDTNVTAAPSRLFVCGSDLFDVMLGGYLISTIVGLTRRTVLGDGLRFPEGCAYAEEWLFYLQEVRACPAGFVDRPLCLHHHTAQSLSRTNRQANAHQLHRLFLAMRSNLAPLSNRQARVLHRHLATATAQLGYIAMRERRFAAAAGRFAQSLRHHPRSGIVAPLIESVARTICPFGRPANTPQTPAPTSQATP